jgi:MYXO-CTERM domain-containing protein
MDAWFDWQIGQVPEPGTRTAMALGLAAIGLARWRRRQR